MWEFKNNVLIVHKIAKLWILHKKNRPTYIHPEYITKSVLILHILNPKSSHPNRVHVIILAWDRVVLVFWWCRISKFCVGFSNRFISTKLVIYDSWVIFISKFVSKMLKVINFSCGRNECIRFLCNVHI